MRYLPIFCFITWGTFSSQALGQGYHCDTEMEINGLHQVCLKPCPIFTYLCFIPVKWRCVCQKKATWWHSRTESLKTLFSTSYYYFHMIIFLLWIAKLHSSSIAEKVRESKWTGTWTHTQTASGLRAVTAQLIPVRAINNQVGCTRNTAQEHTPLRPWAASDYFEIKGKCEC